MELSKVPTLVVGLIVAILIVTVVAIPIIEDSNHYVRSYENNSTQRFLVSDINSTIDIKPNESGIYTVNGLVIPQAYMNIFVATDDMICFYGNSTITAQNIMVMCTDGLYNAHHLNISDGTWSAYSSSNEVVISKPVVGKIYCLSESGDYGYFNPNSSNPLFVNNDSNLMAITYSLEMVSGDETLKIQLYCRGTFNNLEVAAGFNVTSSSALDPSLITLSPINSEVQENDSVKISNATTTATLNLNGKTYTGQRNMALFAPIEYKAISTNDSAVISIINIIPILLIVSMLITIVGTVFVRTR